MPKIGRRIEKLKTPTIDIAIPFNDIEFDNYSIGFMKKYFRGKCISCSDQIAAMCKSIKKNWPEMSGRIYALHSEKLPDRSQSLLEELGVHIIYAPIDSKYGFTLHNKITAYENFSNSDFTLQLDSDVLFLKKPLFDFSCLAQAGYESTISNLPSTEIWVKLYQYYGLEWKEVDNFAYKKYQLTRQQNFMPCINNGAILVKNTYKPQFKHDMLEAEELIAKMGFLSDPTIRHYFLEIAASIAFQRTPQKSLFAPGINFIGKVGDNPYRLNYNENVSLYHYTGSGNGEIDNILYEYFI